MLYYSPNFITALIPVLVCHWQIEINGERYLVLSARWALGKPFALIPIGKLWLERTARMPAIKKRGGTSDRRLRRIESGRIEPQNHSR
jgi:hypothetical protein